jgi:rod shape determining protein RodA
LEGRLNIRLKKESKFDWILIFSCLTLIFFGLVSIYSAVYGSSIDSNFTKQLISVLLGLSVMTAIIFIPESFINFMSYIVYGISILLLVAVLFIGESVYGTKGWISLGSFNLQPAEFAKIGTLLALASYLSGKGKDIRTLRDFGFSSFIVIIPAALIFLQPDVGSASVLFAMFLGILFWSGFSSVILYTIIISPILVILSLKDIVWYYVGLTISSVVMLFFKSKIFLVGLSIALFISLGFIAPQIYENLMPHQQKRISSFLNPDLDPQGAGYNVIQSKVAVGSGGIIGKGFLEGTQTQLRYIPMQWTDFIFSVPAEEFGLIGSSIIILAYLIMLLRILNIAYNSQDTYFSIVSAGALFIFLYHITINIGMVIGIMPVMGIPLPFMSYGGTSVLFNLMLIGLLLNSYRTQVKRRLAEY